MDQGGSTSGNRTRQEQVSLGSRVTGGGGRYLPCPCLDFALGGPCWILTGKEQLGVGLSHGSGGFVTSAPENLYGY